MEGTPLLTPHPTHPTHPTHSTPPPTPSTDHPTWQTKAHSFLEGKTGPGRVFEDVVLFIVLGNVVNFMLSTTTLDSSHSAVFDWVEGVSVVLFTIEYLARCVAAGADPRYAGILGRLWWACSFYALIDAAAILPWFVDLALGDRLVATQFIRILRVFRMFRAEGRYFEAFSLLDDVVRANAALLLTTSFAGAAVWLLLAGLLYVTEAHNPSVDGQFATYARSMWWALLNLLGEYPLASELSDWGKVVSCFAVVLAVGVFSIPTGIIGAGFLDLLQARRAQQNASAPTPDPVLSARSLVLATDDLCQTCARRQLVASRSRSGWRGRVWLVLEGHTSGGKVFEIAIMALIVANVIVFSISTIPSISFETGFFVFETLTVLVFTAEYLARVWAAPEDPVYAANPRDSPWRARLNYVLSFNSFVDVASTLPYFVDLALTGTDVAPTTLFRVIRLIRLFKADAYVHVFDLMDDVVRANADLLATTGWATLVIWILASSLMYATERHNDNPEVASEFTSVPAAMWITLLNLTGEYPLGDYTPWGKVVSSMVALVAIGIAAIPTAIWSAGFEDILTEAKDHPDPVSCAVCELGEGHTGSAASKRAASFIPLSKADPEVVEQAKLAAATAAAATPPWLQKIHGVVSGTTPVGQVFEAGILLLIVTNTITFILSTVASIKSSSRTIHAFDMVEGISVGIFTLEYLLRVASAPADVRYSGSAYPRLRFMVSVFALVDLAAIVPLYIEWATSTELSSTIVFRLFRLLLLLKGEAFVSVFTLLDDVFAAKASLLASAAFVASVCLIVFATLLHYVEKDNHTLVGTKTMAERFESVPSSLWYALVALTGDYPLYQFTTWGKIVNFGSIVVAVGLVGIPSGIIASGFMSARAEEDGVDLDDDEGEEEEEEDGALDPESLGVPLKHDEKYCRSCRARQARERGAAGMVYAFLVGDLPPGGMAFEVGINALIGLNLISFALSTEPSVRESLGGGVGVVLEVFEIFSVVVFTLEYGARLFAAGCDPDYGYSRVKYATSFFALVDLFAIAPFYIGLMISPSSSSSSTVGMLLRTLRVVRVFKAEHYWEAFTLFDNVVAESGRLLLTTSFASLLIWIFFAALFYYCERDETPPEGAFDNMLLSLFGTMIYLGGEWFVIDLSIPGQIVGSFVAIVAIAIFAIPGGILFDGFDAVSRRRKVLRDRLSRRHILCGGCGVRVKEFIRHHIA